MNSTRVYVTPVGEPIWNRFVIRRGRHRYWTGKGWSHDPGDALLYHNEQEAASQAVVLHDSIRPRRFVTSALISIDMDEPLSFGELQELLDQTSVSLVLPEHEGHVNIEITVDWKGIEEIE
jgi:hypothetical protein